MKKVIINHYAWYYEDSTEMLYEYEDKTGANMHKDYLSVQERSQLVDQLRFNTPMITH